MNHNRTLDIIKVLALALLVGSYCGVSVADNLRAGASSDHRCVGVNYFHETWTDTYSNKPKFSKTNLQMKADFELMKQLGATAVRIHGANKSQVEEAVTEAKTIGLEIWLSYRPNMRDLNIAQDSNENEHPAYPRDLPGRYFVNPEEKKNLNANGLAVVKEFREAYVTDFAEFLKNIAKHLKPGDVLVVANEITIDLGYDFDNTSPVPASTFLQHLFEMARHTLPNIELTFATMPSENRLLDAAGIVDGNLGDDGCDWLFPSGDWDALYEAGMNFVSLNSYWSNTNLRASLVKLQNKTRSPTVAVTEFGAVAHVDAFKIGGDGIQVASNSVQEYNQGKATQLNGVREQLAQIEGSPLRGKFVFAWDETFDNVFGIVQTNLTPLPYRSINQGEFRDEPGIDFTWLHGCEYRMDDYLPVGKDACNAFVEQWVQKPLLRVVLMQPPPDLRADYVELSGAKEGITTYTSLKCSLKTEFGKYDQGACKYMKLDEAETSFYLFDETVEYSLIVHWQDGKETKINLEATSDLSPAGEPISWTKDHDAKNHVITICFEPGQLQNPENEGLLDLVLCIDKSGSMSDDLDMVQKKVDEILGELESLAQKENISIQVGLVLFQFDGAVNTFEVRPLTKDVESVRQFVKSMDPQAVGGDEDLYAAMMYSMNEEVDGKKIDMGWRHGAAKMTLPITDEAPKDTPFSLSDVSQTAFELDPVHVYPLLMPKTPLSWLDPAVRSMHQLADATGGEAIQVESAEKLPEAIIAAVKLAIRQHKEEVWRKENPPYVLYGVGAGIGVVIVLALAMLLIRGIGRRPAAEVATLSSDPRLTGQSRVTTKTGPQE